MPELPVPSSTDISDNPDLITGVPGQLEPVPGSDWGYTVNFEEYQRRMGKDPTTYQGRDIIGRDTKIDGGVYTGTYGGEAIVVDSKKYPDGINKLMQEVKIRAFNEEKVAIDRGEVLRSVFNVVSEAMPYSKSGVQALLDGIAKDEGRTKLADGTKVALDSFIQARVGVCRHQALTAGLLLEMLKDEGIIRGQVSVDRNKKWNPMDDKYDGHAWVRYTSYSGTVMILDVAQGYFGRLEDSEGIRHGWDYMRPEDKVGKQVPK